MRKYLQACEVGGSIYGKKHSGNKRSVSRGKSKGKGDIISAYDALYKRQLNALNKVMGSGR